MREFDYDEYLSLAEIPPGAIIDVASDTLSIMMFCKKRDLRFDFDHLIDAMKRKAGDDGTIMIRTFSWAFCKGVAFDIKKTMSEVGVLGSAAIGRPDFRRTQHPLYSWMVWGKRQEELCNYQNINSFGPGSLFDWLDRERALQLTVGKTKHDPTSISHHAEVMGKVPYRKEKFFEAAYIDETGYRTLRKYSMHVRPLNIEVDNSISDSVEMREKYMERGIRKYRLYQGELPIITVDEHALFESMKDDIQHNDGINTITVNGIPGIRACGVDWNEAVY